LALAARIKGKGAAAQAMPAAPAPWPGEQQSVKGFTGMGLAVGAAWLSHRTSRAPGRNADPTRSAAYTGIIHRQSIDAETAAPGRPRTRIDFHSGDPPGPTGSLTAPCSHQAP